MSNPSNTSRLKTLIIIILVAFAGYMIYSNSEYESKLIHYSNQIARLQVKDSIASQYFEILDNDSVYILPKVAYKNGQPLTYSQLDSLIGVLEHQIRIKDMIIEESQSIFNYQYSITEADSIIRLQMKYTTWQLKSESPSEEE